jgi:hypothetical protein
MMHSLILDLENISAKGGIEFMHPSAAQGSGSKWYVSPRFCMVLEGRLLYQARITLEK